MEQQLREGTTNFFTDSDRKITKDMPVFYNPVMKRNRDTTLAVLLAMRRPDLRIGLPMEASGLRAARILNELVAKGNLSPQISINDLSAHAISFAKKNIELNIGTYSPEMISFTVNDASQFLRSSRGFDYIDIDPFGSPNPFLDSAIQRIHREGILAVTATDTSALAGTYPSSTARKYWSVPSRTWVMHDVGLRILIRKVQLIGAQYDKALIPVLSLATDHYYRIFFRCNRSHADVRPMLKQHQYLHVCPCMTLHIATENSSSCKECGNGVAVAGPLWVGSLHDATFVSTMREEIKNLDEATAAELEKLLAVVASECTVEQVGFVDLHELASRYKLQAPKTETVLELLKEKAARTHINGAGIKTTMTISALVGMLNANK